MPSPADQLIETQETSGARMESLHDVTKNTSCSQAGEGRKNLIPLYEALYADAQQASESKEDQKYSLFFLQDLEMLTLGSKEALDRYYERKSNLK